MLTNRAAMFAAAMAAAPACAGVIAQAEYNPNAIYTVLAYPGYKTMIELPPGVEVDPQFGLHGGKGNMWSAKVAGNRVTITPKAGTLPDGTVLPVNERWNSNLLIPTAVGTYVFDIKIAKSPAAAMYLVRFTRMAAGSRAVDSADTRLPAPANKNYWYDTAGAPDFVPKAMFDDGKHTYVYLPPRATPPVVKYIRNGTEFPANARMRGDGWLWIPGVRKELLFDSGPTAVKVTNRGYVE